MAIKTQFVTVNAADRSKFATQKSTFQRSRFNNGMELVITGYDFVHRKDEDGVDTERAYPVLTCTYNGQPFDNIFLSTLVRPDQDIDFNEIPKVGSFNLLAIAADSATPTDEACLQKIVADLAGRHVKVVRKVPVVNGKKVRTETYGREHNLNQLNFDIVGLLRKMRPEHDVKRLPLLLALFGESALVGLFFLSSRKNQRERSLKEPIGPCHLPPRARLPKPPLLP